MPIRLRTLVRTVGQAFEPLAFLPLFAVLHWRGLANGINPWLVVTFVFAGGGLQLPAVQLWLSGGDLHRRRLLRLVPHMALTTGIIYGIGWGPVLGVAFVVLTAMYMQLSGASIWRLAIGCSLVSVGAGQAMIAVGWVRCYLPLTYAHTMAAIGALATVLVIRLLGISGEQREQAYATVQASEERFRALVHDSSDVIAVIDRDGATQYVSPSIERVLGYRPQDIVGTGYGRWVEPEALAEANGFFADLLADPGGHHRAEMPLRHLSNGHRWVEVTARNLLDNPAVQGIVVNYRDVTERRAIQERLAYDASHDALTGLANRATFLGELEKSFADAAVLFIDLDGFKQINDTLGHEAGDGLIVAAGAMLVRSVLGADMVGRLGGDEFGVLLPGIDSAGNAISVVKRILAQMAQPVRLAGTDIYVRASIGVAVSGPEVTDAAELLHRADTAMYAAKRRKTHSFQLYTHEQAGSTPYTQTPARMTRTT